MTSADQTQSEPQLDELRQRIDAIDEQIQNLIGERIRCVLEVAKVKQKAGGVVEYYRPEREAQLLRRIKARNPGPLSDVAVARLFREIVSASMALEQVLSIAFNAARDTLALQAVYRQFGQAVTTLGLGSDQAVFQATLDGQADFGVVIADDDCAGLFCRYPLSICGEVIVPDHKDPAPTDRRFLVVGKQRIKPSGDDKTTLLITQAEQQPRLLDLPGHHEETATQEQIAYHESHSESCRCLGSYPANVL